MRALIPLLMLALTWPVAVVALTERDDNDLADLVASADAIVVGRVEGGSSVRIGRGVYTVFEIAVEQTLKGPAHDHLSLAIPGGVDPEALYPVAQIYPGVPIFQPAERAFLFLRQASSVTGAMALSSMLAGKVTVTTDAAGKDWVTLGPSASGRPKATRAGPMGESIEGPPGMPVGPAGTMPAERFAEHVEALLD